MTESKKKPKRIRVRRANTRKLTRREALQLARHCIAGGVAGFLVRRYDSPYPTVHTYDPAKVSITVAGIRLGGSLPGMMFYADAVADALMPNGELQSRLEVVRDKMLDATKPTK